MNKMENSAKWSKERFDAELSKAISEINNGAPVADAEKFIKGLMI